jgi:hypothetical protein
VTADCGERPRAGSGRSRRVVTGRGSAVVETVDQGFISIATVNRRRSRSRLAESTGEDADGAGASRDHSRENCVHHVGRPPFVIGVARCSRAGQPSEHTRSAATSRACRAAAVTRMLCAVSSTRGGGSRPRIWGDGEAPPRAGYHPAHRSLGGEVTGRGDLDGRSIRGRHVELDRSPKVNPHPRRFSERRGRELP